MLGQNMIKKVYNRISLVFSWIRNHKYLFVTIVFLVIVLVLDDNNMIKHIQNKHTISKLEDEIAQMKRDSAYIVKKQDELDHRCDVEVIERLAREKYGMHQDNEDDFVIEKR